MNGFCSYDNLKQDFFITRAIRPQRGLHFFQHRIQLNVISISSSKTMGKRGRAYRNIYMQSSYYILFIIKGMEKCVLYMYVIKNIFLPYTMYINIYYINIYICICIHINIYINMEREHSYP